MLKYERTSERLHRASITGGLLPSVTLVEDLIKFLNQACTKPGKRIAGILEQMLQIEEMTKPVEGVVMPAMSLKKTDPAKFKLLCEIDYKVALLQRELANFKFVPRAEVAVGGGGGPSDWATWWKGSDYRKKGDPGLRMRPTEALETILRLTHIRCLSRLRRCAHCGKWLYAKFRHQTFCSVVCQQKSYTQTEEWKAHRREYMKNYYRMMYRRRRRRRVHTSP
jgi:hypothetical protein